MSACVYVNFSSVQWELKTVCTHYMLAQNGVEALVFNKMCDLFCRQNGVLFKYIWFICECAWQVHWGINITTTSNLMDSFSQLNAVVNIQKKVVLYLKIKMVYCRIF